MVSDTICVILLLLSGIQGSIQDVCSSDSRNVRLVGGQSVSDGRVEICSNGIWQSVCQDSWDAREARVICRQVGYDSQTAVGIQPWSAQETGPVYQWAFDCVGNESDIFNCTTFASSHYGNLSICDNTQNVGVVCIPQGDNYSNCTDGEVRLVDGVSEYDGRLEVCYRGIWGTVCGYYLTERDNVTVIVSSFDVTEAWVICNQLGYHSSGAEAVFYGSGEGPIHLDNVNCTGNELSLDECAHSGINEHQCSHSFDIGIICPQVMTCLEDDIRLVGPSQTFGRVELCTDGLWGTVCEFFWDARDARVVCRQLGFESETAISFHSYGGGTGPIHRSYVMCHGNESTLSQCPTCDSCFDSYPCVSHEFDAAVDCFPQGGQCTDKDIRLVDGLHQYTGRLEICHAGYWGSVCGFHFNYNTHSWMDDFTIESASVACRQLGYSPLNPEIHFASVIGSGPIFLDEVRCQGNEEELSNCPHALVNEFDICDHLGDLDLTCKSCTDDDVQLVDGGSPTDGRVEVCVNGEWGSVCHNYWDARDASVVCRQLGYESDSAIGLLEYYPGGEGHIHSDYVQCTGDESRLTMCPLCSFCNNFADCSNFTDAGVICHPNATDPECNETEVRLVGGASEHEGTVEICHSGLWGTICGWHRNWLTNTDFSFFRDIEASVICNQLGFSRDEAIVVEMSYFPLVTGLPIYLDNVRCTGNEESVLECGHADWNVHECWHNGDVGIICQESSETETTYSIPPTNQVNESTNPADMSVSPYPQGAIFGTAFSVLLALVIVIAMIIVLVVVYRRRRSKRQIVQSMFRMDDMEIFQVTESVGNAYLNTSGPKATRGTLIVHHEAIVNELMEQIPEHMLIPSDSLRLLDTIGQGEFGIVYKAHLIKPCVEPRPDQGGGMQFKARKISAISLKWNPAAEPLTVAVKTLKGYFAEEEITEMIRESVKMQQFDHSNVLSLLGICTDAGPAPYIVMPFMANGSLISYLKRERSHLVVAEDSDEDNICAVKKRLIDMCLQIAKGMEYLSSMKVIHRDLAARNCMIDTDWIIKVADFGLSEKITNKDYIRQNQDPDAGLKLPVKWMAPESLSDGVFSEKSDIWSYGITTWEVFSGGKSPYPGIHPTEVFSLLDSGKRLRKPCNASCCDSVYSVMKSCWEADPAKRPAFSILVQNLNQLLESLSDYLDVRTFLMTSDLLEEVDEGDN